MVGGKTVSQSQSLYALVFAAVLLLPSASISAESGCFWADTWRPLEGGASLVISEAGTFEVISVAGEVVASGTVECVYIGTVEWAPGFLSSSVVLRFVHEGKEWLVSGYRSLGEGGPSGLLLFADRIYAEWLFGPFGVTRESSKLELWGPDPTAHW